MMGTRIGVKLSSYGRTMMGIEWGNDGRQPADWLALRASSALCFTYEKERYRFWIKRRLFYWFHCGVSFIRHPVPAGWEQSNASFFMWFLFVGKLLPVVIWLSDKHASEGTCSIATPPSNPSSPSPDWSPAAASCTNKVASTGICGEENECFFLPPMT